MFFKSFQVLACSAVIVGGASLFGSDMVGQHEEHQLVDRLKKEVPSVAYSGPLALANLNLNHQGSVIAAEPGEKVFGMLNFQYDSHNIDPESLNQIVIGFSKMGAQKCIFNELGYRCNEGIASFFLQVPQNPGIYEIQCRFDQAFSSKEAMINWSGEDADNMMTIGKIIVRE